MHSVPLPVDRRSLLVGSASLMAAAAFPRNGRGGTAATVREFALVAAPGRVSLVGRPCPDTDVWSYNASVPGPEIRARQGERFRISVENQLSQATAVHWHGLRAKPQTSPLSPIARATGCSTVTFSIIRTAG
jgi:FtsP/CotA-like multicopper oxidase with cupredoxin domain